MFKLILLIFTTNPAYVATNIQTTVIEGFADAASCQAAVSQVLLVHSSGNTDGSVKSKAVCIGPM